MPAQTADVIQLRYAWSLRYYDRLRAERQVARWDDQVRALKLALVRERDHDEAAAEATAQLAAATARLTEARAADDAAMTALHRARCSSVVAVPQS